MPIGLTPLALACVSGHLGTIKKLVELGANVNGSEKSEIQPLHHASAAGNLDVVEYLVSHGADIHAHTSAGTTGQFPKPTIKQQNICGLDDS